MPKMPQNHPNIYTKLRNSGHSYKHRDFALLETRYWQKGCVKQSQNSLHVYPRLNHFEFIFLQLSSSQHEIIWQ